MDSRVAYVVTALAGCSLLAACSTSTPVGSPSQSSPSATSTCDAGAPTGDTLDYRFDVGDRQVVVSVPRLPEWSEATPPSALEPGTATHSSYDARTGSLSLAYLSVEAGPPNSYNGRLSPAARSALNDTPRTSVIDDERDVEVCGNGGKIVREHPIGEPVAATSRRGWLRVICDCGGDDEAVVDVTIRTSEPLPKKDPRNLRESTGQRNPSLFEDDMRQILANVEIIWKDI